MSERAPGVENQIRELKVSGHTMALEPGMYCVYNAPGGSKAGENGLPGVRITAAPGAQRGQVSVAGFTADGWIGVDSAALVHVSGTTGTVLVTVYQAPGSQAEAPKLQVVRLSDAAVPAQPEIGVQAATPPVPAKSAEASSVEVVAHVYGRGDLGGKLGNWIGEPGSQRWIEGFGVAPSADIAATDIEYQAVLGRGWLSPWSEGGQFCGSRGMSLPILGMRIRLKGAAAKSHRVMLSATFVDGTRVGPVGDGEACEAPSLAALEAFELSIVATSATTGRKPAKTKAAVATPAAVRPAAGKVARAAEAPIAMPVQAPASSSKRKAVVKPDREITRTTSRTAAVPAASAKPAKAKATKPATTPAPVQTVKPGAKPGSRASAKRTPATTRRR